MKADHRPRITAMLLAFGMLLVGPGALWAKGKAESVVMAPIANSVQQDTCLACHTTVKQLHDRGAHSQVNCGACHTVKPDHISAPSAQNRPATRFDQQSCAQCHPKKMQEMLDPKYHMAWAERGDKHTYSFIRDGNTSVRDVQYRVPRFHVGILADIAVNRMGGRFAYKDPMDEGRPVEKLWDKVIDKHPERGNKLQLDVASLPWRPHKGVGLAQWASCLKCKSTDNMMDYAWLGEPGQALLQRDSAILPTLKTMNSSFNCNFCHDPHSAEPRVVNDILLQSLVDPAYKDNEFQKRTGKTLAKVEVVEMGVRGYPRKIGILDRYDSNLMCGQCHLASHESHSFTNEKGETKNGLYFPNLYTTVFADGPLAQYDWYMERGLWNTVHPVTGTKWPRMPVHAHAETVALSVHGEAGVGCSSCHFARNADGTAEHQPSLPREKVANTCMNSSCHGPGSKTNWKTAAEAKYAIDLIQQRARVRRGHWQNAHNEVLNYLADVKNGRRQVGDQELADLHRSFGRSLQTEIWWSTDYSDSIHNPRLHEKTVTQVTQELKSVLAAAKKTERKEN